MAAEWLNDWKVTVLAPTGHEIGTVSISRTENFRFTEKRLWGLVSVADDIEDRSFVEYAPIELVEKREARFAGYDQRIMDGFRSAFPSDNVDRLFEQHRPTESINGRAYFLVLLEAILRGFKTVIDCHVSQTWVTINV